MQRTTFLKPLILTMLVAGGTGCIAAAGAGLGAGIYLSDRGAESTVASPVDRTFAAAEQAFRELGIGETRNSTEREGASEQRVLSGTSGDRQVSVTLNSANEGTRVEVVASTSAVTWDKELARKVLERIVKIAD